jgi:tetratricopeptide (TPR) repeat protein
MTDGPNPTISQVSLINSSKYLKTRPSYRVLYCLFLAAGSKCLKYVVLVIAFLLVWVCYAYAEKEELSDDQARQQCFKGKTIYCLALGIKEEKSGNQERALELYRTACKKHPSPGHLRACTPLLGLAWKMNRLDEEAVSLEIRCQEDDPITCFYLGQEYLKLVEMEKAARHLEPLCRNHFRPPDPANYGPCYHLAKGYEQAGQWNRALELFQFDCESHAEKGQPSCVAMKELVKMERVHWELRQKGIRGSDPVEGVLFFVVFMSVLNTWIWFKGGRWGLKYLSLVAPLLVWGSALTWVYWPEKPEFPISQWVVIYFALLQVSGMAIFAFRKLQTTHISR